MKFNTIVSADIGLSGGLSLFQDNQLVAYISMPTIKVETKPARYKLDLLNGKKQFIKSGPKKGQAKTVQISAAKYDIHLALNEIKDFFTFSEPEKVAPQASAQYVAQQQNNRIDTALLAKKEAEYKAQVEQKNREADEARKKAAALSKKKVTTTQTKKFDPLALDGDDLNSFVDGLISGNIK